MPPVPILDLDGTLIDSDAALVAAFIACGVPEESVTFGHVLADECARLGISLEAYLSAYDDGVAEPFPGIGEAVAALGSSGRWAICSNKHPRSGRAELVRLGWEPEVALFSDAFCGAKSLGPVLAAMDLAPAEVVFVGDTAHDRECAHGLGVGFWLAGWNPRRRAIDADVVLDHPGDLLERLALERP